MLELVDVTRADEGADGEDRAVHGKLAELSTELVLLRVLLKDDYQGCVVWEPRRRKAGASVKEIFVPAQ